MIDFRCDGLDHLDARSTGAENPDPFAGKIDRFFWPPCGVIPLTRETVDPRKVRLHDFRQPARAHHQKLRREVFARFRRRGPALGRRVEICRSDLCAELDFTP